MCGWYIELGASDDRIMILCHNPVQDIFFPGTVSSTLDISESGELDTNGLAHCTVFGQEVLMVLVASLFANDSQWTGTLTVYIICGHVHTAGYWNDFTITYGSRSILVKGSHARKLGTDHLLKFMHQNNCELSIQSCQLRRCCGNPGCVRCQRRID